MNLILDIYRYARNMKTEKFKNIKIV